MKQRPAQDLNRPLYRPLGIMTLILLISLLAGCSDGSGSSASQTLVGYAINGPLEGATVEVYSVDGTALLGTTTTDASGRFEFDRGVKAPYRVRVYGGMLDGQAYTGVLESHCSTVAETSCNVTPYTTLLVRLMDELNFNPDEARTLLAERVDFSEDPFIDGSVSSEQFDLVAVREVLQNGAGLDTWLDSFVGWLNDNTAPTPIGTPEPTSPNPIGTPEPTSPNPIGTPEPTLPSSYTINATAGEGGSIGPTSRTLNHGGSTTFTVTPATGYSIANVTGCDGTLNGTTYTTGTIISNCSVEATFSLNDHGGDSNWDAMAWDQDNWL